jgi:hypothetical protein
MNELCPLARFVTTRIDQLRKKQKVIAAVAGLESNMITMIKQGDAKRPLARVGGIAGALETDPGHLLKLCLSTYYPDVRDAIAPYMATALTDDELRLLASLRAATGEPFIAALSEVSRKRLAQFIDGLRVEQSAIH